MSCISAAVLRIGGVSANTSRIGGVCAAVAMIGGISANTSRIGGVNAAVTRRNGINVSASLLCEVGVARFLKVLPKETQWISVTIPIDYNVLSNVEWIVL